MNWRIEYEQSIGMAFKEEWVVTNGERSYKAPDEEDAEWLCTTLNNHELCD